jgi:hypothetical protein
MGLDLLAVASEAGLADRAGRWRDKFRVVRWRPVEAEVTGVEKLRSASLRCAIDKIVILGLPSSVQSSR